MELKTLLICFISAGILFMVCVQSADIVDDKNAESGKHHSCDNMRHNFSGAHSNFLLCAINYSEPVLYCQKCVEFYIHEIKSYKIFTANATCRSIYVDNDRLNIIQTTYASAKNLWNAGSCSECFACNTEETPLNCTQSNSTLVFNDLMNKLDDCITGFLRNETSVCLGCVEKYEEVNYMYNLLKKNRGENICFDIKDAMNKTRIRWSKEFHCCEDRNSSKLYFFSIASCFSTFAVIFYVSACIWGKPNDNDYESLDDESYANRDAAVDEPSTSATTAEIEAGETSTGNDLDNFHKRIRNDSPTHTSQVFI